MNSSQGSYKRLARPLGEEEDRKMSHTRTEKKSGSGWPVWTERPQVDDNLGSFRRRTNDYWSQSWWISAISFLGCLYIGAILTASASGIRLFNEHSLAVSPNTFARCMCGQISILRRLIAIETSRFLSQVIPYMYQNTNFEIGISMLRGFTSDCSWSEAIQHLGI